MIAYYFGIKYFRNKLLKKLISLQIMYCLTILPWSVGIIECAIFRINAYARYFNVINIYYIFFMIPKTRIKFLVIFLFLAHCVAFGKLVSELQWIFFSGHFGGRFISLKPLKQVFSATSLRGFLWVFRVVPTVSIWVFMWKLIINCKKSAYFTFGACILHWKLLEI